MKKIVLAILLVGTVVAGTTVYTSTDNKAQKSVKVVTNKIENNIRKQTMMSKNQKHGARYTRQQWDDMHIELNQLRKELDQLRRNLDK
ncbi:hypothetical protein VSU16_14970 (plasmid) [Cetobacterium somerae]|uniref:hypothetical protein n=1 Tax=Cetobacterium somerae TaxID=188913 RepID=UPI002E7B2311|nr:hypothetical protein [Cetobacterium somerae]WVJ03030.1 hypothetical protein VSU16_14970 [Cetobacterium somerae]